MQDEVAEVIDRTPSSLAGILEPEAAIAAAQRMQRWYQSMPQCASLTLFGRDGRRVEVRMGMEVIQADD
jgi:hypothetical protein